MLVFTNRDVVPGAGASAFQRSFAPGARRIGVAAAVRDASGRWDLSGIDDDVTERDALDLLLPLFSGARPVLVFVHGNSHTPVHTFGRCLQLDTEYNVEVVGFSWASEGFLCDGSALPRLEGGDAPVEEMDLSVVKPATRGQADAQQFARRYRQAKTNAQDSVDALAHFLRMVATARLISNARPYTLAAHSLGAHLLQYTLEVPGASESVATAQNVVLLAPCARADGHAGWLHQLRPKGRTYVTFNKADNVLFGAFVADGGKQAKLGVDPGATLLRGPGFRYISFSNAQTGMGGHRYFLDGLTTESRRLFSRLFRSEADLQAGEPDRKVYPVGCDPDGAVGYMALPDTGRLEA
ncbi:alpha/beta hydrolase [Ramlibacter sp. USB13]|uniref:Alpha/beta hydrolase n=1 Tax=Ramlibacter cellulosilyticus TaxID=2764187 RepID=A0A923SES8_9BURK|nr:alpha/beta hydrolase [Ramlibacter cellulosilyticus]MBC5783252.1 alpha/beta hydrolase [Ramlibacter cellulosilyticus]